MELKDLAPEDVPFVYPTKGDAPAASFVGSWSLCMVSRPLGKICLDVLPHKPFAMYTDGGQVTYGDARDRHEPRVGHLSDLCPGRYYLHLHDESYAGAEDHGLLEAADVKPFANYGMIHSCPDYYISSIPSGDLIFVNVREDLRDEFYDRSSRLRKKIERKVAKYGLPVFEINDELINELHAEIEKEQEEKKKAEEAVMVAGLRVEIDDPVRETGHVGVLSKMQTEANLAEHDSSLYRKRKETKHHWLCRC